MSQEVPDAPLPERLPTASQPDLLPLAPGPAQDRGDVTGRLISSFKRLIAEGALVPGCRVPPERELAASFGVARSSLRQALKVLEVMGAVTQRVGAGTYLTADAAGLLDEPMEFLILLGGISFGELMEARLIVEPELAARAATRASAEQMDAMAQTMERMRAAAGDRAAVIAQDLRFHELIFQAAGNRVCTIMFRVVYRSLGRLAEVTSQLTPAEHTVTLHRRIHAAIRRHDPELARRRMAEHIQDAASQISQASAHQARSRLDQSIASLAHKL